MKAIYIRANAMMYRDYVKLIIPLLIISMVVYSLFPILSLTTNIYTVATIEVLKIFLYALFAFRLYNLISMTRLFAYKLFFLSVLFWLPGQVIQTITTFTAHTPYLYPNMADYFMYLAIICVIPGVLGLGLHGLKRRDKIQIVVHAVTFGLCVSFVAVYFITNIFMDGQTEKISENIGSIISLTLDIIVLAVIFALAIYRAKDRVIFFICLGLFFQVIANTISIVSGFFDSYSTQPLQRMLVFGAISSWLCVTFVKEPVPKFLGNIRSEVVLALSSYVSVALLIIYGTISVSDIGKIPAVVVYSFLLAFASILVAQIIGFFDNKRLVSVQQKSIVEISKSEERYQELATHDSLTDLHNRASFISALNGAFQEVKETNSQLAVLFIDLDRFKDINDTYGHVVGDRVIKVIADRISRVIGDVGLVSRLGGDEFSVLISGVSSKDNVMGLARQILDSVIEPFDVVGSKSYLSCSIGIAYSNSKIEEANDLLRNADSAMYRAKELGRNRIETTDSILIQSGIGTTKSWSISDLHNALAQGEIKVYYQPIYELSSEVVVGFEALARWEHPSYGLISPQEFIPIAEDNGLIVKIGNHVIDQSIKQLSMWNKTSKDFESLAMNINLSYRQLNDANLIETIIRSSNDYGVNPSNIIFEMTESSLLTDVRNAVSTLNEIQAHGFRLQIDDFGTGYSSLAYLKKFPISGFKIDRTYIQGFVNDGEDEAIVKALVGLGVSMNLDVTAEGIDTKEVHDSLKTLGCKYAQGYYYSKALPAQEIILPSILSNQSKA